VTSQQKKKWAVAIGLGLAILPIHNRLLTELATNSEGQVLVFIPTIGFTILILGVAFFILKYWSEVRERGFGNKRVWIPMLVIVGAMALSGFVNGATFAERISPMFMGITLFGVYLVARILGEDIFEIFAPFILIKAISIIVLGLLYPGQSEGGFITNQCASAGYLIFGALVYRGRWRIAFMIVAGLAVFFIGTLEAVFIIGVLGITLFIRKDVSRKLAYICAGFAALVITWWLLGYLVPLYTGNGNLGVLYNLASGNMPLNAETMDMATTNRWSVVVEAFRNFSFVGHGYSLSTVGGGVVHNMPVIIMNQVGPLAALAWVFVTIYLLVKTGWKYAWMAVLAMGVFDHYLWTQMAPWWWALAGVASVRSDLIFRRAE